MTTLLKKDFLLSGWKTYIWMAFLISATYIMTVSPTFMFILAFFALAFSSFSHDDKVNVNRFLVSLPIDKKQIIKSRYVYSLCIVILTLLFQFFLMNVFAPFSNDSFYVYNLRDLIVLFCIGAIIIAICTPIIYFVRSLVVALGIILLLFGIGTFFIIDELVTVLHLEDTINFNELDSGFVLLAKKYFPWQPYLLLPIVTGIIVYLSITVSISFFTKKDM